MIERLSKSLLWLNGGAALTTALADMIWNSNALRPTLRSLPGAGKTVLITGATDGIGAGFTRYFAALPQTPHLIISGRCPDKLAATVAALQQLNPALQISSLLCDFSALETATLKLPAAKIDWLISCAGLSYPSAQYTYEISPELIESLLKVNFVSTVTLIEHVLRHNGAHPVVVVACGSGAATVQEPLLSVYAASKAALKRYVLQANARFLGSDTSLHVLEPYLVTTRMSRLRKPSFAVPSVERFVRDTLQSVLCSSNKCALSYRPRLNPYWVHCLVDNFATRLLPDTLWTKFRLSMQLKLRKYYRSKKL